MVSIKTVACGLLVAWISAASAAAQDPSPVPHLKLKPVKPFLKGLELALPDLHLDSPFGLNFDFDHDFDFDFDFQPPAPPVPIATPAVPVAPVPPVAVMGAADSLYRQAQELIDSGRYERAIERLERLLRLPEGRGAASAKRVDAALYWKAYSQSKLGQVGEALTTLADMQKRFADSRWLKDARALEVQVRQASGQAVSPDSQADEELKLLALRGIMQSDPDRALPMIEKLLAGNSSIRVKQNALFVLSQSRSARAREIITAMAKGGSNPDLQLRAVRYLGAIGGPENRQILDEVYRSSSDIATRRAILRSFMASGDRARLLALARNEPSPELRGEAVQQLGAMRADAELWDLYQNESSADVKRRIMQAMFVSGSADRLIELAKLEKDPQLRRSAIRSLGQVNAPKTAEALRSIYASDANMEVRREVVNALFIQRNATALIELARAEKDPAMKKEIVSRLAVMKSKEATDYLLELLK